MSASSSSTESPAITAAAAPPRKPRTLAELMDEQVKEGRLPAEEANKPVEWRQRSNRGGRGNGGGGFSGGNRRWNEPSSRQDDQGDGEGDASLNWQQKELLGKGRRQPQGGPNGFQGRGRGSFSGGGDRRGGRSAFGQDGGGGSRDGGMQRGRNEGFPAKPAASDMPEWATGLEDTAESDTSGLNWQQKSLMTRDESNPFNRLVRGEDEYFRE